MRPTTLALLALAFTACVGEADYLGPSGSPDINGAGHDPSAPVTISGWQELSAGLPSNATFGAMAQFDGVVYAVANGELYALPSNTTAWSKVALPLRAGERVTSVARIDLGVYATTAGTGVGGVFAMQLGQSAFTSLGAPDAPAYAVAKKGGDLLLATDGMLYAFSSGTWAKRSAAGLFAGGVRALVAAPSAVRMFAAGNGGLFYSDDSGATWTQSELRGDVTAIAASGASVLVQLTVDGTQRSDNYGSTFHPIDSLGATSFSISGAHAFAGTGSGVKVSDDAGASWHEPSTPMPQAGQVSAVFYAGSALFSVAAGQVFVAAVQ